jgi:hypothetical protein
MTAANLAASSPVTGRPCTICTHARRGEIEAALTAGVGSFRNLATQFGVGEAALRRHAQNHIPDAIAAAVEAQQAQIVAHGSSIITQVRDLHARALACLAAAEGDNDRRTLLGAIREARATLELVAKLEGQLQERAAVQVNVVASPEWTRLRGVIVAALAPHPEARLAVAAALEGTAR